jgi:hypothetical protein
MMLKIRQHLTIQQIPKHADLVSRFLQGHPVLNFTEGHQPSKHSIHSSVYPPLKKIKFQEFLEDVFSESMKNSNLIQSNLSMSELSALSIFFTLDTKGMGDLAHFKTAEYL